MRHRAWNSRIGSEFRRRHDSERSRVITPDHTDQGVREARHNDYDCAEVSTACVPRMPGVSAQRYHFTPCNVALKIAFKGKIHIKAEIAKLGLDLL